MGLRHVIPTAVATLALAAVPATAAVAAPTAKGAKTHKAIKADPPPTSAPPAPNESLQDKVLRCSGATDLATFATPARVALFIRCMATAKA